MRCPEICHHTAPKHKRPRPILVHVCARNCKTTEQLSRSPITQQLNGLASNWVFIYHKPAVLHLFVKWLVEPGMDRLSIVANVLGDNMAKQKKKAKWA